MCMNKTIEKRVLDRLEKSENKKRYNFTLSPKVKRAFKAWCQEKKHKESAALESLIQEMVPKRFF